MPHDTCPHCGKNLIIQVLAAREDNTLASNIIDSMDKMKLAAPEAAEEDYHEMEQKKKEFIPVIGADGRCECNCGSKCPLGRMGVQNRCTLKELLEGNAQFIFSVAYREKMETPSEITRGELPAQFKFQATEPMHKVKIHCSACDSSNTRPSTMVPGKILCMVCGMVTEGVQA